MKGQVARYISTDDVGEWNRVIDYVDREVFDRRYFTDVAAHPPFWTPDFKAVPARHSTLLPEYVKNYGYRNRFAA